MTSPDRPTTGTGASPLGEEQRKRTPWWLLILLAAIIIVALILLLSRCGGDSTASNAANSATSAAGSATSDAGSAVNSATSSDGSDTSASSDVSTPAATSPDATTPSTPAATAPAAESGSLTANGTALLPIATAGGAGGDLSKYVGQAAAGKGVMVLSAPADNGFWVGISTTDQVYVHLLQPGLVSPHPVRAGDHISFTGKVVANSATLAADDGVTAAEGAAQLTAQKAHLEIAKTSVVFTS